MHTTQAIGTHPCPSSVNLHLKQKKQPQNFLKQFLLLPKALFKTKTTHPPNTFSQLSLPPDITCFTPLKVEQG